MSNRDRIFHAAAEARAGQAEKLAKKAAKEAAKKVPGASSKRSAKASAEETRMKLVWGVFNSNGRAVVTFPYPEKDAGEVEARRLTASSGTAHELRAIKVPMD